MAGNNPRNIVRRPFLPSAVPIAIPTRRVFVVDLSRTYLTAANTPSSPFNLPILDRDRTVSWILPGNTYLDSVAHSGSWRGGTVCRTLRSLDQLEASLILRAKNANMPGYFPGNDVISTREGTFASTLAG